MRRVLDARIIRWQAKAAFVVGAWLLTGFVVSVLLGLSGSQLVVSIVDAPLTVGAFLLGARIFRGRGEAIVPARPWWRMTARPKLSRRLGILFVAGTVILAVSTLFGAAGVGTPEAQLTDPADIAASIITTAQMASLAFLYVNSANRLVAMPVAPTEPTFRQKKALAP